MQPINKSSTIPLPITQGTKTKYQYSATVTQKITSILQKPQAEVKTILSPLPHTKKRVKKGGIFTDIVKRIKKIFSQKINESKVETQLSPLKQKEAEVETKLSLLTHKKLQKEEYLKKWGERKIKAEIEPCFGEPPAR